MATKEKSKKNKIQESAVRLKEKGSFEAMKESFGYKNVLESPRLKKIVISTGIGSIKDKNRIEIIQDRLARITGQKPAPRPSKKSIAAFKVREGDVVGYQVTLRGPRMYSFLDRLLSVSIPRTRDFRGFSADSIDEMGNYTIGIREHTIFPETSNEELKDVFGLAVTFVTSARSAKEAEAFLSHIGLPFKKAD